ncbi:hypothetical protein [Gorillibacterium timonense]|uniref:hypothetical protein n=1 Tax=Gorillibacterium timonense TaxID=1689269 RepID=UPI00071E58C7|nr:hypothetical protein [Gorillibacterium timonense]
MNDKIAAHFSKPLVTKYRYERLRHCDKCGSFTSLRGPVCSSCKRSGTLKPLARIGAGKARFRTAVEALLLTAAAISAVYLSPNAVQRTATALLGAGLLVGYGLLLRRYSGIFAPYRLHRLLVEKSPQIADGLDADEKAAEADYEADRYRECYEKLREVGVFVLEDRIRYNKIICLGRFVLRKDMDLELESVVPRKYSKLFVHYMWEVSKVNRTLIREKSLDYALRFRSDIEKLSYGTELLTNVASAALRSKTNLSACEYLIGDYAIALPRDRFIRLCGMLSNARWEYPNLTARVAQIAESRYAHDPEVQALIR